MNSRGTLMSQRISGDTLASKDSVAMTPTVQPAAAGTQRSRERDRLPGRVEASVTDREDMPLIREIPGDAARVAECNLSCLPPGGSKDPIGAAGPRPPRRCYQAVDGC